MTRDGQRFGVLWLIGDVDFEAVDREKVGGWREAIADGSIRLYGEPSLVRALRDWFGERPSAATSRLERVLATGS